MGKDKTSKMKKTDPESVSNTSDSQNGGVLPGTLQKVLPNRTASTSPTAKYVKNTYKRPGLT